MTRVSISTSMSLDQEQRSESFVSTIATWIMPAGALLLVVAMGAGIRIAKEWPLILDAPLIHYVVFLMDHGRAPYRDIVEMNMPGTYILQWLAIHALGGDAFGLWLWDAILGLVTLGAGAWIAGANTRPAGIAGGALAYLSHLRDGPKQLGQRDWEVAVILLVAFGCMFESIRTHRPAWMAGFMGLCGFAASIKPPAIGIGIVFLIATCWLVRRKQCPGMPRWASFVGWSLLGGSVPAVMVMLFLMRWGVTREFIALLHGLVPWYAGLQRLSILVLIERAISLKLLLLGAIPVFFLGRSWRRWESDFLAVAALAGTALFIIQGKGWIYHLYPELIFLSLWGMLELDRALRGSTWERAVATAALVATLLMTTPLLLKHESAATYPTDTLTGLESDLYRLGGAQLSGKIQCLDMTMGSCINVLYRMKLVQATGFIYDFYLFPKHTNSVTAPLQARFLQQISSKPPEVIVLSSHTWPGDIYSYDLLDNWPAFEGLLQQNYTLDRELPRQPNSAGYRIYVLNQASSEHTTTPLRTQ